jgi:hypothetical protein
MHQDTKPSKDEGTLTEFHVTERYVVRARTIDEANNMIAENCFDDSLVRHEGIDIYPNF